MLSMNYITTLRKHKKKKCISCYILIVKTIYESWHLFKCYFIKLLLKVYMRHLCRVYVEYFYVLYVYIESSYIIWILLAGATLVMFLILVCSKKSEALNTYIHNKIMQHLCLRPTPTQPPLCRVCKWSAAESVSGTAGCWWTVLCYERWLESEPNHADMILAGVPFIPTWIKDWRLDSHSEDT